MRDVSEDDETVGIELFGEQGRCEVSDLDEQTAGGTAASPVVMVTPTETLERAAQLMTEHSTSHLVVVDVGLLKPVGVITTLDIVAALDAG